MGKPRQLRKGGPSPSRTVPESRAGDSGPRDQDSEHTNKRGPRVPEQKAQDFGTIRKTLIYTYLGNQADFHVITQKGTCPLAILQRTHRGTCTLFTLYLWGNGFRSLWQMIGPEATSRNANIVMSRVP